METSHDNCPTNGFDRDRKRLLAQHHFVLEAFAYESTIRARLFRYTRNLADTEELVQETYLRLLAMKDQGRLYIGSVLAFAMAVAHNIARDWLRHQRVLSISLMPDLDSEMYAESDQPDDVLNLEQELEFVADIVDTLSPRCRQAFTLRKVYGMSQKEIATTLGISVHTVEQHLRKAARQIDEVFTKRRKSDVTFFPMKTLSSRCRKNVPVEVG